METIPKLTADQAHRFARHLAEQGFHDIEVRCSYDGNIRGAWYVSSSNRCRRPRMIYSVEDFRQLRDTEMAS